MPTKPLMVLFDHNELVNYKCHGCGIKKTKFCGNEKKFKLFIKENTEGEKCKECNSKLNLFENPHGEQYWSNHQST